MTKLEKLIYGAVAVCIIALIIMISSCFNRAWAWKIWDLAEQINALQDLKQQCYDKLTYRETARLLKWEDKYCYEYDEEIQTKRAELDELTHHDYTTIKLEENNIDDDFEELFEQLGLVLE